MVLNEVGDASGEAIAEMKTTSTTTTTTANATAAVEWKNELVFYLNGKRFSLTDVRPDTTLLEFLRSNPVRKIGTKLACGEGGCGACTVMISHFDAEQNRVINRAVNACILPLFILDGKAIVTVEGIGSSNNMHPVQERIATANGSQCGFCTPGFVMSLYAYLRSHPHATGEEIESCLDGNLCRCTGYRPILDAARSLETTKEQEGVRICPSSGKPCSCGGRTEDSIEETSDTNETTNKFPSEPIFPPALRKYALSPLIVKSENGTWFRPTTLDSVLQLKTDFPQLRFIVGSTEVSIERKFKHCNLPYVAYLGDIPELNRVVATDKELLIGGAVSLTLLIEILNSHIKSLPEYQTRTLVALREQLRWFGGTQIRNVACLAGNIATASPISDINPVFMASGASITVQAHGEQPRRILLNEEFFMGYRKTALKDNEVITTINLPFTKQNEFVFGFKQSRRREDDIAIVSSCFRVQLSTEDELVYVIKEASLSYGGMAPFTKRAAGTEAFLLGKQWNKETLQNAYSCLLADLPLELNAPGGMINYRRSLSLSFFFKFFISVCTQIESLATLVTDEEKSLAEPFERPPTRSAQVYDTDHKEYPIGQPVIHQAATKQVTGEALYADDISPSHDRLHACYVISQKPHARIKVDPSDALKIKGVVAYFDCNDIPGKNTSGTGSDEPLFCVNNEVNWQGQAIGLVVAETSKLARLAARTVKVEYEELERTMEINEAIEKDSILDDSYRQMHSGDAATELLNCDHVIEGDVSSGGQDHFYLEPHTSVAWCGEEKEIIVLSSAQNISENQCTVASLLGISMNKVEMKVKRVGGGFGGKETKSIHMSAAAALASFKLRRMVSLVLEREENMVMMGSGRHPFYTKYKIGFTKEGIIKAASFQAWNNGGYVFDLSVAVLETFLMQLDNAYYIPNFSATGYCCKTNRPSPTAFRAFSRPQMMVVIETVIDHIAKTLQLPNNQIRELNFYKQGQLTPYNQVIEHIDFQGMWSQLLTESKYNERIQNIKTFNSANKWKKRGIACVPIKYAMGFTVKFLNQASALVHIEQDGTVLLFHGGCEMGQGLHTKMIQIASKALKIPIDKIHVLETSTNVIINASPTAGSFSTDLLGPAVKEACDALYQRLKPLLDQHPNSTFAEVAKMAFLKRVSMTAHAFNKAPGINYDWKANKGKLALYWTTGVCCTEVEIDCLTGSHQVLHTSIVMDVGKSINPALDVGQIEGAFVQGQGFYTLEEVVTDPQTGCLFTKGPSTYKIPTAGDIPIEFNVSLYNKSPNPNAIYQSRGIGEPPLPLASSIFFAIKDAIYAYRSSVAASPPSFFRFDSPATCEKIRMHCEDPILSLVTHH